MFVKSTNGLTIYDLNINTPYIFGTNFRLLTFFKYSKYQNDNYFGRGANASDQKLTDHEGNTYNTYDEFRDKYLEKNNYLYYKWNNYILEKYEYLLSISREITDWFHLVAGVFIKKINNESWDGRSFKLGFDDEKYISSDETLFSRERPFGFEGGWSNCVRFGFDIDTRDFEPNPHTGFYFDYAFELYNEVLGSDYDFNRSTTALRLFIPIGKPLTIAMRLAYTDVNKNAPFNQMNLFAYSGDTYSGLGGDYSGRGYIRNRFVGRTMTLATIEPRWTFYESRTGAIMLQTLAFWDTGNVFDNAFDPFSKPRLDKYKHSFGAGFVFLYARSLVIHLNYGVTAESQGIYLDFSHVF